MEEYAVKLDFETQCIYLKREDNMVIAPFVKEVIMPLDRCQEEEDVLNSEIFVQNIWVDRDEEIATHQSGVEENKDIYWADVQGQPSLQVAEVGKLTAEKIAEKDKLIALKSEKATNLTGWEKIFL